MTNSITWGRDIEWALDRARRENLPILLFFHNPG